MMAIREAVAVSVLIVVAHPDDEVLGCAGTAALLTSKGHEVRSCLLSGAVEARADRPHPEDLVSHVREAERLLGMGDAIVGEFPNLVFNTTPHIELVRFIEEAMVSTGSTTLFTHHPADLNDDHRHTSLACQAAARLWQRRPGVAPLQGLYYMEVPSSTDWSLATGDSFHPNAYVEIGEWGLERKLAALEAYQGVMRPFPHPRSPEALRGLAAYRGGQAGMAYAEAFQTAFSDLGALLS